VRNDERDGKHTIDKVKGTLTAGVADLDASLTNMNGNDFSHFNVFCGFSTGLHTDACGGQSNVLWRSERTQINLNKIIRLP
jgi:hypothetical protein